MTKIKVMLVNCIHAKGGAERVASLLLSHLSRERFELSLCLFWRRAQEYPIPEDVPVYCLEHHQTRLVKELTVESSIRDRILYRVERRARVLTKPLSRRRSRNRFRDFLAEESPDVILSLLERPGLIVGETLRNSQDRPAWVSRCGNNPRHSFRGAEGRGWLRRLRKVLPYADFWVANSGRLAEHCNQFYPELTGKTTTLFNPVDIEANIAAAGEAIPGSNETNFIVCLARLVRQKRFDVLLQSFRKVSEEEPTCKLLIIGEGPERPKIEAMISQLELKSRVRLLGRLANPFPFLKKARLLVSASEYEGLPNAMLEAQSLGVPVVATDCDFGVSEVVSNDHTGLLSPTGDAGALARNQLRLLGDERLRSRMGLLAQKRVREKFGLERVIRSWEALILEAGNLRKGRRTP
jgi:GalNAc-alpha-(1->4)-GalNAc-alpha-(1->3)-diNAcBac-PP-undecaprenol alpha-1,4-N-acetyl-D-galactosaminyltransferase